MKIGILSFHYGNNYGGILQCFALLTTLKQLGHDPEIINYRGLPTKGINNWIRRLIKKILFRCIHGTAFLHFRKKYLNPISFPIRTDKDWSTIGAKYDVVIAGSDQIWRYVYVKDSIKHYFLDFVSDGVKKLSYAASFGKDEFEGDQTVIEQLKLLMARFDAISVREKSGVDICRSVFGFEALRVLDPTMLLLPEQYELISGRKTGKIKSPYIAYYFLDCNEYKKKIVEECSTKMGIKEFISLSAKKTHFSYYKPPLLSLSDYKYQSVFQWLLGIRNAEFVVTDSFHGIVFSILFNKQFLCIGNEKRGLSRMDDILGLFGLKDRLITETNFIFPESRIDYSAVNEILAQQREMSVNFLLNSI